MKVYLVQVKDRYVGTAARPLSHKVWNGDSYTLQTESDPESARHYNTKSAASTYLKNLKKQVARCISRMKKENQQYKKRIKDDEKRFGSSYSSGNWLNQYITTNKKHIKKCQALATELETFGSITELEIEKEYANTADNRRKEIKFDDWVKNRGGGHQIHTPTNNRKHCKKCGVKLKEIPTVRFLYGNCMDICIFCMREIASDVERAYNAMPEDHRKNVEAARFMERM